MLNYSVYISGGGSLSPKSIRAVYLFRECVCVMDSLILCSDADQPAGYDGVKTLQH